MSSDNEKQGAPKDGMTAVGVPPSAKADISAKRSLRLVDPELLPAATAMGDVFLTDENLGEVRKRSGRFDPPIIEGVTRTEIFVPGPDGAPDVRMLVLVPDGLPEGSPCFFYIHGGGYVLGRPEDTVGWASKIAQEIGCVVFLPSYRLAPDTTWEGSRGDLFAALKWVHAHAEDYGCDPALLAIGGGSAGGGHAAGLAIHSRDHGGPPIILQLLMCPMLDDRQPESPYLGEFIWTREPDHFGWKSLLGTEPGGNDVPVSAVPARATDLTNLPPAFIEVGAIELFAEACIDYAKRLMNLGIPVELHLMPGAYHGYEFMVADAGVSKIVDTAAVRALRVAFDRSKAQSK
jgi:acetyl esterase/lipase